MSNKTCQDWLFGIYKSIMPGISISCNDLLRVSFGIWNSFVCTCQELPLTPHMSVFWKSQLNELTFKLDIWRFLCIRNPIISRTQNGKIEINKSVILSCGIHRLSYLFEQCDKFRKFICLTMRTVNKDGHYTMQHSCRTSENTFPKIFEKKTKDRPKNCVTFGRIRTLHFNFREKKVFYIHNKLLNCNFYSIISK